MPSTILIQIATQQLQLLVNETIVAQFPVSTAQRGVGQQQGSLQTPLGQHYIRAKIGHNAPINSVFVARRPTGEIYSPTLAQAYPDRDWILSRILWLCGCEPGINRLGSVDTFHRYIYIHGTPDTEPMGIPASHGCIRMRNSDLVELFDRVDCGTLVRITL
ncbi:L,D-transpeptidase [Thiomicrospira cyclica]|uniref:ErfK/YbiS/YcfS/YnhG family protein n=1 Tax=Thiomicrospira cyclica (strain DSM 14477 / JCM 11371 / ALM1) TaxID=717773 RepID=F6D8P0_THICA|nr:L,D-transpeptidase [Thiomicrospira cyclica]AEG31891.1 ErfK/YbiS/YcfS/YnhG family protein [Thiomicrospira cyclica ALM1]